MTEHRPRGEEAEAEMREAIEEAEPAVDELEQRSAELEHEIEQTERDWESKQHESKVPGAQPDPEEVETERQDEGEPPAGEEG